MCWTGKLNQGKIAEKDIPVMKILDKVVYKIKDEEDRFKYFSPIQHKQKWVFNEPVSSKITIEQNGSGIEIYQGLHSINPNTVYEVSDKGLVVNGVTFPHNKYVQVIMCEGYIPAGSIYYDNGKTLVSTNLVITNEQ